MQDNQQDKKNLRMHLLKQREALSPDESQKKSDIIVQKILTWNVFQSAKHIALYQAFRNEVNVDILWRKAHSFGKKTYFPVIATGNNSNKTMRFLEANSHETLHLNHFNIPEPSPEANPIDINNLDCLFIPLVAFDKFGYRLGMGQGYYDRALTSLKKRPYCIGVAYSFQEVNNLPHDPWDMPLDAVVTDQNLIII